MVFGSGIWCRVFAVFLLWLLQFSQKSAVFFYHFFAVIFYCPSLCTTPVLLSDDTSDDSYSDSDTDDSGQTTDRHRLHGRVTLDAFAETSFTGCCTLVASASLVLTIVHFAWPTCWTQQTTFDIHGGPKNWHNFSLRLNFTTCWPIFTIISLSESGENL